MNYWNVELFALLLFHISTFTYPSQQKCNRYKLQLCIPIPKFQGIDIYYITGLEAPKSCFNCTKGSIQSNKFV